MSSTIEASGTTLQEAIAEAVAALLDRDRGEFDVRVAGPGSERFSGRIRLDLEVTGEDVAGTEEEPSERTFERTAPGAVVEEASEARADVAEDARADVAEPAGERSDEAPLTAEDLDEEADAAADFLEGLLDALDLPGDLRIRLHEDHAELEVVDIGSGALIGRRGQTLEAIQELLRCSLQRQFQRRARVKVDAEGYRARRLEKLIEKTEDAIDAVLETGEPERLEPMDVFERKAVHQLVADVDGLVSRSQGREPARRVVIERE